MATAKRTRTTKTAAMLLEELEKAKAKLKDLEQKAYAGELKEAISSTSIVAEFKKIKERYKDVSPVNILQAIGVAVQIPRVVVSQSEVKTRKKK